MARTAERFNAMKIDHSGMKALGEHKVGVPMLEMTLQAVNGLVKQLQDVGVNVSIGKLTDSISEGTINQLIVEHAPANMREAAKHKMQVWFEGCRIAELN